MSIRAFLAYKMLLLNGAALRVAELDELRAEGVGTRARPGLFDHITAGTD